MSTRAQLARKLSIQGIDFDASADSVRGIPAILLRHLEADRLVVTVGGDLKPKDRVNSLVHALSMVVSTDGVDAIELRLGSSIDGYDAGVLSAIGSLLDCYVGGVDVQVTREVADRFAVAITRPANFDADPRPHNWAHLLREWYQIRPLGLARDVLDRCQDDSLRLYPQLSKAHPGDPEWSLRLDGLGIGGLRTVSGWMQIGKKESKQTATQAWGKVTGAFVKVPLDAIAGADIAAGLIGKLIAEMPKDEFGVVRHRQPEHSLESMVLKGTAQVVVDGRRLELPHEAEGRVQRVAWGSQIPTLWWPGGTIRYLDALMRAGSRPYAVELKVQDGGGYGRYLREALTQAVLYRHFIRSTTALHAWTRTLDVEPTDCGAVVAFPKPTNLTAALTSRLAAFEHLCGDFDVNYWEIEGTGL